MWRTKWWFINQGSELWDAPDSDCAGRGWTTHHGCWHIPHLAFHQKSTHNWPHLRDCKDVVVGFCIQNWHITTLQKNMISRLQDLQDGDRPYSLKFAVESLEASTQKIFQGHFRARLPKLRTKNTSTVTNKNKDSKTLWPLVETRFLYQNSWGSIKTNQLPFIFVGSIVQSQPLL